jgi:hypothetical protein
MQHYTQILQSPAKREGLKFRAEYTLCEAISDKSAFVLHTAMITGNYVCGALRIIISYHKPNTIPNYINSAPALKF